MPSVLFSASAWVQPKTSEVIRTLCLKHGKPLNIKKHTQLLDVGFNGEYIYLLTDGFCRFVYHDQEGKAVTLSILLPGRSIGDFSFMVKRPIQFALEVMQDSIFRMIHQSTVIAHLEKHPEDRLLMEENVKERYRSYLEGFYSNAALNTETRFSKLLEVLAGDQEARIENRWARLTPFLTQELMADVLATNRITIHKLFQKWKNEGRIRFHQGAHWVALSGLSRHDNPFSPR